MELELLPEESKILFEYKTLEGYRAIRLIVLEPGEFHEDIHLRLDHVLLSDSPQYEALSYAWGDASLRFEVFLEEGSCLEIGHSLFTALRHLRQSSTQRSIWADAICINQQDNPEKSIQVQLMGEIYASSQQVLVWLGEETPTLISSFLLLKEMHQFLLANEPNYPYEELVYDSNYDKSSVVYEKLHGTRETWRGPLFHLLTQKWFSRRWVIQEIAKAPRAIVICGLQTLSWDVLGNISWCLYRTGTLIDMINTDVKWDNAGFAIMNSMFLEMVKRDSKKKQHAPMLNTVFTMRLFECTDPKDVIYSLLGVASDVVEYGHYLTPDYSLTVEEVFTRFVTGCILQKGSLHPLSLLHIPPTTGARDLPSWVVDLSRMEVADPRIVTGKGIGNGLPFHAGGSSVPRTRVSNDGKILYTCGRKLDMILKRCFAANEMIFKEYPNLSQTAIHDKRFNEWLSLRYDMHSGNEDKFEMFWRTMMFNLTEGWDQLPLEYGIYFQEYLDHRLSEDFSSDKDLNPGCSRIHAALSNHFLAWSFCETEKGRYGQVLASAKQGDVVCILYGGELPYIIRPLDNGEYMFISSCYIHGLMDGEGLVMEGAVDEEFCFR